MKKNRCIEVHGKTICVSEINQDDYISLTDMAKGKGDEYRAADIIKNWLRSRTTLEFLGAWEMLNNPDFKVVEFDHFRREAGLPTFVLSVSQWVEKTSAIGICAKSGKYGGTYAHKDIAFEFGSAISPQFKLYLIKEFQRLKEEEGNIHSIEWNYRRLLAATNYRIHTDAVKEKLIPWAHIKQTPDAIIYAAEADLINLAIFGLTAKQWREMFPAETNYCKTIRDCADTNRLIVLSNLESINSMLIRQGMTDKKLRFDILRSEAIAQLESLNKATKDLEAIESPNKKRMVEDQKKLAEQTSPDDTEMPFGQALNKIANAGKPDK